MVGQSTFPECEQFEGRKKAICRREVLTKEKQDVYRITWGLDKPSHVTGSPTTTRVTSNPQHQSAAVPVGGVGTELERLFAGWSKWLVINEPDVTPEMMDDIAKAGQASCLGCQGLAALLNQLGPDRCEAVIDDDPDHTDKAWRIGIVSRIKVNAGHHKIKMTGMSVSSLPFFETIIRRFVVKAISRAREKTPGK